MKQDVIFRKNEPLVEIWLNVYPAGFGNRFQDENTANMAKSSEAIYRIHVKPKETRK